MSTALLEGGWDSVQYTEVFMKKLFQGSFAFAGAKVALFSVVVQLLSLGEAGGNDDGCGMISSLSCLR